MMKELDIEYLKQKINQRERFSILDVRTSEDFLKNSLSHFSHLTVDNLSYQEMVQQGGKADPKESIKEFIHKYRSFFDQKPHLHVICNRGRSSVIVTNALIESGIDATNIKGGMQAWNHYHEVQLVIEKDNLKIFQIIRPAKGCLSYIIAINSQAIIIDPSRNIDFYKEFLTKLQLTLTYVLDTHAHADHISGGHALAEFFQIPYILHPYDGIHPVDLLPASFNYQAGWENLKIDLDQHHLRAIHIPGHTLGNQAFLLDELYLFSGDSIFINSISRPDLGGKAETWTVLHFESLKRLNELPPQTIVLPGHFEVIDDEKACFHKTLDEIRNVNEGFKKVEKGFQEFQKFTLEHLPQQFPPEYMDIKRVNLGLLKLSESELNQLEVGKNICSLTH